MISPHLSSVADSFQRKKIKIKIKTRWPSGLITKLTTILYFIVKMGLFVNSFLFQAQMYYIMLNPNPYIDNFVCTTAQQEKNPKTQLWDYYLFIWIPHFLFICLSLFCFTWEKALRLPLCLWIIWVIYCFSPGHERALSRGDYQLPVIKMLLL